VAGAEISYCAVRLDVSWDVHAGKLVFPAIMVKRSDL
jgi:hypothetical protein